MASRRAFLAGSAAIGLCLPHANMARAEAMLGDDGVALSEGEKQRVTIARALLRDPRIIILDEATSALDVVSEHLVQQAINRLIQGRTTLIVAHRLSTIRNADQVLVLKDGQIIQRGKHTELVQSDGFYHDLYMSQFSRDIDFAAGEAHSAAAPAE